MNDHRDAWLDIPWDMMETMIAGKSGIDVPRLYLSSMSEAEAFLQCYGYEWNEPEHRRQIEQLRLESLDLIENDLLADEAHLSVIPEVRDEKDIRKLLLWASNDPSGPRQRWSCSLLRVIHTFNHCGSYFQEQYEAQIREQILERFRPHIRETDDGLTLGMGPEAIPLAEFQMRGRKSRKSLAMKLLQKAENVSADIFDWVGVRFVTKERFDTLLVAKYLREHNIVMFAHVRPGRSRNTLVDLGRVKQDMNELDDQIRAGRLANAERLSVLRERQRNRPYPNEPAPSYNPFSSRTYNSIQFTCSQQIRVRNPHMASIDRFVTAESTRRTISRMLARFGVDTEIRFFFPFEVQILDQESFERSRSGFASHAEYKARQRAAVKRRLWGRMLDHDHPDEMDADSGDYHAVPGQSA